MGKDAADAFEANTNVFDGYNKLFIQQGLLNPATATVGVTALGTWRGIPLYASEEQYEDTDGSLKYYVPPKDVLVAASGIQSAMAYAAATGTKRPRKKLLAKSRACEVEVEKARSTSNRVAGHFLRASVRPQEPSGAVGRSSARGASGKPRTSQRVPRD